jgi:hypothetical protein
MKGGIVNKKIIFIPIMLLFLIGCVGAPRIDLVDQTGRSMPTPHYVLESTDKKVAVLFYYTVYSAEKDLDGYEILVPKYLNLHVSHNISLKKYKRLVMNFEVQNPTKEKYTVWETIEWRNGNKADVATAKRIGYSNRRYRSFAIEMPYGKGYKNVKYAIFLRSSKGQTIMHLGEFKYSTN